MHTAVLFCLLAVLLAVTNGQFQNIPGRFAGTTQPPTPVNVGVSIQEELERTETLIRHEMDRLRQLQLQQMTLAREQLSRPAPRAPFSQPQRGFVPETPRDVFTTTTTTTTPSPIHGQGLHHPLASPTATPVHHHPLASPTTTTFGNNDEALFRHQAESAHYNFNAATVDGINDNTNFREETRDGLKVSGMYSYSDGFFKRTTHYEADENGYRVVKETVEPIGNGPQYNDNGSADVMSQISGRGTQYHITTADIANHTQRHQQHRTF